MLLAAIQESAVDLDFIKGLIKTASEEDKRSCLDYLVRNKKISLLKRLVKIGLDINQPDFAGQTALHSAVLGGNADMVNNVLEAGADPNIKDFEFESPVDIAFREKLTAVLQVLLKEQNLTADQIKKHPSYGKIESVSYAQNHINENLITFLRSYGNIEKEQPIFVGKDGNCNGWAFLFQYYLALDSEEEFWDILKCISLWDPKKSEPYDVLLKDIKGISPKLAEKYRSLGKLMFYTINDLVWFQHGRALSSETGLQQEKRVVQWEAIKRPDEKIQLKNIFNIKAPSIEKNEIQTMLDYAKRWPGSWIDIGIYAKADIHQIEGHAISIYVTPSGKFKFYDSNRKKRLPEIASSNIVSNFIMSALRKESVISNFNLYRFYPADENVPEIVAPSIAVEPDHYKTNNGKDLLIFAAMSGEIDLVKNLLNEGAIEFLINNDEKVFYHLSRLAIFKDDAYLKSLCTKYGMEFTPKIYQDTARRALAQGEVKALIGILQSGELKAGTIDSRNEDDLAALHLAVYKNDRESVNDLLRLGANKELRYDHETPLFQAARLGHKAIAKTLIRNQANIDFQKEGVMDDAGFTPLHIAIQGGHTMLVKLLLLSGANTTLKDNKGRTAFEITPLNNHKEIALLIEKFNTSSLSKDKRKSPLIVKKDLTTGIDTSDIDPSLASASEFTAKNKKKSDPAF